MTFVGNWPFGPAYAVTYDSSRQLIFLGSGRGVYIVDVASSSNPLMISDKIHTQGVIYSLFYNEIAQKLYVPATQGGLEIWDVSNVSNLSKLASFYTRNCT